MIKDAKFIAEFEISELKKEKLNYIEALRLYEWMWMEGVTLGVLPVKDPLEEIETDINLARILNHV